MNVLDYAYGIACAVWIGSLVQFAIVMASSARRQWGAK
jgi:putative copper export protein